ncbi:MAG: NAD(P)-dependent oxidoreductase [Caldilineaceae bacterium]
MPIAAQGRRARLVGDLVRGRNNISIEYRHLSLYKQPVGLIGYGGLAKALQPLLAPFGCPISVYDPWLGRGYLQHQGVTPVDLGDAPRHLRFIFVLAVPSAENQTLLSRKKLALIQDDAVFVLISLPCGRFWTLTEAVAAGRFRAAIDVFPGATRP